MVFLDIPLKRCWESYPTQDSDKSLEQDNTLPCWHKFSLGLKPIYFKILDLLAVFKNFTTYILYPIFLQQNTVFGRLAKKKWFLLKFFDKILSLALYFATIFNLFPQILSNLLLAREETVPFWNLVARLVSCRCHVQNPENWTEKDYCTVLLIGADYLA